MVRSDDAPLALRAYRDHIAKSAHQEATVHHHPTILGPVVEDRRRDIAAEARRTRPIEEEHREPLRRRLRLRRREQALAPAGREA